MEIKETKAPEKMRFYGEKWVLLSRSEEPEGNKESNQRGKDG